MSNTVRIKTTPNGGDKYLKVQLDQDIDFIEILSLKISQEDTYRKFCSDYGVIVGRVVINSGFGVPNAKVSVFIPLDDIDKDDPLIKGLYPFEVITDRDSNGVRYNLLSRDVSTECHTSIGSFPSKREILDNETMLNVYCKYYKFTTTTNHAGDFMIFGVPLGTYTVHVDADISDIGNASQRPYDLISQGTPAKLFASPTKFKGDTNLDKLIQVKTMNAGVNVQPFWGDTENCEIGINRLDFDLNYSIRPSAIFMGSIYGDQDKHSINKRCRPRKKLGVLCDQVTGAGSINMIRKNLNDEIEEFDIDGGRLIDDDGTWAYQIPMNLDYMVTDEEGNLILSQDPNKGVPTRARVRFNIGMDETGSEGRLRTRARYLVPNNPTNANEVDYTFGDETKDTSFRDFYWNKIYSVSNFISRFQRNTLLDKLLPAKSRSMTAIKDVDDCAGDKTPYPYNRVDTEANPIFFIICLIIKIIAFLVYILNSLIIPLINLVIRVINFVIGGIVSIINSIIDFICSFTTILGDCGLSHINFTPINFIPCISIKCPDDDASYFAPGCKNGGLDSGDAFQATSPAPNYYDGDPAGHSGILDFAAGLDNCIAFEMAKSLNMFKFDFYNDWINGSLFGFLLKYKKKRKGREIFCEYDCDDWGIANGGVDGNENGTPDNNCHNNILLDTCYQGALSFNINGTQVTGYNSQNSSRDNNGMRDGLIKKVDDEFYYAASTHNTAFKLFATDIINLGSVFDCDWQAIPNIHELLIPTTYKIPPDIQELADNGTDVEACGMVDIGGNTGGEFFSINCIGLHVDFKQCLNLRHICEIGVDIDQAQEDPNTGAILVSSDCIIGVNDIDDDRGKWIRDVFFGLNSSTTPWIGQSSLTIPSNGFDTNFNLQNNPTYNFATGQPDNGDDYSIFRNYANDSSYTQPSHSFYFYFGILPGKTALDKMNQRFFTKCNADINDNDIIIQTTTTVANGSNGTITFTFFGGVGPYTYTVSGVPPVSYMSSGSANPTQTLTGLAAGTYTLTAIDSLNNPITQTITVSGPPSLYCSVNVTQNATTSISNDGKITISSVGGGTPPYTYKVLTYSNVIIAGPAPLVTPLVINGLPVANTNGYKVIVTDSASNTCTTTGLTISGPNQLVLSTVTKTNVTCFGGNDGAINLFITGGQPPLTITTTGPAAFTSNAINMVGLIAGTYVTTVVDSLSTTVTASNNIIPLNAQMGVASASSGQLAKQCSATQHNIPFFITAGTSSGPVFVQYSLDGGPWNNITMTFVNSTTLMNLTLPANSFTVNVGIRFRNSAGTCFSNVVTVPIASVVLPTATLACNIFTFSGPGLGQYTHVVSATGGFGPYSGTGSVVNTSPTITTSVTDNVGCVSPPATG